MSTSRTAKQVHELSPERIERNPENPRLIFRAEELDSLLASIGRHGILVPITVYQEGNRYILIDGERRWRCARKLNLNKIPVLIQKKPSELDNLLLMFNIHALREQWDYLTIANKLPRVIALYKKQHDRQEPSEIELSDITGLTRGQIRRCKLILDLPDAYRKLLFKELDLPKAKQRLSEDFFIEMERAIKTIQNRVAGAIKDVNAVRDVLIAKYRSRTIDNITDFRKLAKIATSVKGLGVDEAEAKAALKKIFSASGPGIDEVFDQQFGFRYDEKKFGRQVEALVNYLDSINIDGLEALDSIGLREPLERLKAELDRIFEGD
jgi:ParB family chromosome partitioning protein